MLSIHPYHAHRIFDGTKTAELRRTRPQLSAGDQVLVYVSSPIQALLGGFEVATVVEASPVELWRQIFKYAAVSSEMFQKYFAGADTGYAIQVKRAWKFAQPTPLNTLRSLIPGFHPPQIFRYLNKREIRRLGLVPTTLRNEA